MRVRAVTAVVGVAFALSAVPLWMLDRDDDTTIGVEWAWPYVFALAGLLAVIDAIRPHRHVSAWSGALLVGACLSRATALAFADHAYPTSEVVFRVLHWVGYGFALSVIWALVVVPGTHDG